jgi:hypothetical protein
MYDYRGPLEYFVTVSTKANPLQGIRFQKQNEAPVHSCFLRQNPKCVDLITLIRCVFLLLLSSAKSTTWRSSSEQSRCAAPHTTATATVPVPGAR